MTTDLRVQVLLSMQKALLGNVTPAIRAVAVKWTTSSVKFRILFDHLPTPADLETTSLVETEVMSDFPEYQVRGEAVAMASPTNISAVLPDGEALVYSRAG
jgi:hypothetical protein